MTDSEAKMLLRQALDGPRCKGCWSLGSGCGHCYMCIATAPEFLKRTIQYSKDTMESLRKLRREVHEGPFIAVRNECEELIRNAMKEE